ncbi:hypothetical protein [Amycolatopsis sp.]|jgi:hypothetical protein|uniref:hypothetical protein n=1 Tax=Amycolatopsis sp. TaxID=37632 RepID=UPI002DFE9193|nr:hypothetical protein [Amycolatopsis sp.]
MSRFARAVKKGGSFEGRVIQADKLTEVLRSAPRALKVAGARIVGELDLSDLRTSVPLTLTSCRFDQPIRLERAHLSFLDLSRCTIPAIYADGLRIEHGIVLSEVRCLKGGIDLTDAVIGGTLLLSGAELANDEGAALDADRLVVSGSVFLRAGFRAEATDELGAVRMFGARIGGQLDMSDARVSNTDGPAFGADGMSVEESAHFSRVAAATTCDDDTIRLRGVHIGGQLRMDGAQLTNTDGPAVGADGITVDGDAQFTEGFRAETASPNGTVRLAGARIGGELQLWGAQLKNSAGPAFLGDHLVVGETLTFGDGFRAEGAGPDGCFRLFGARISGQLIGNGGHLVCQGGPALTASTCRVESTVLFNDGFRAESTGDAATIIFIDAHFGTQLSFRDAEIVQNNPEQDGIDLDGVTVKGSLVLPLSGTRVDADGLTYAQVPWDATLDEWLSMLAEHPAGYRAQPYQQLAKVHRAAGHERDARRILIAQQRDLRRRGDIGGPFRRLVHRLSGVLIGYGYRPWRPLGGLLATVVLALLLTFGAGARNMSTHSPGRPPGACTAVENVAGYTGLVRKSS